MNADLAKERHAASFNVGEMTNIWDDGITNTERRRKIEKVAMSDFSFLGPDVHNLSRDEVYSEMIRKHASAYVVGDKLKLDIAEKRWFLNAVIGRPGSGYALNDLAFVPTLRLQASDEQLSRWLPLIESYQMLGCYAQTELGHGTFLRGLETTATYDPKTEEFVMNTPLLTSTKWWVGCLGRSANTAVVIAQLYTKNKCEGVHAFLVPLRNKDHQLLRGVTTGDIGPKFGMEAIDNGFMRLDGVRIPRENMLMKYSKVLPDGTYVKPENDRMIYSGMLSLRVELPLGVNNALAEAVAIAVRYSCVRRQSELNPKEKEPQVLDYQTQQHKLFPLLAMTYAFRFSCLALGAMLQDVMREVNEGNYKRLIEAHALSSGMKAITSQRVSCGIEVCRLACGGHGFLQASSFPTLYTSSVAVVTAEGEYTVLLLQTARYLMKNCVQVQSNKRVDLFVSYLNDASLTTSSKFGGNYELNTLLQAFQFRAFSVVTQTAKKLQHAMMEKGMTQEDAWNSSSVKLVDAARAHIDFVIFRLFVDHLNKLKCSTAVHRALVTLGTLHGVYGLLENSGDFLREGYLTRGDSDALTEKMYSLYERVRVDAVAYVDAFDMENHLESSALGRYDGNVYENLFQSTKLSDLNKTQVHSSFNDYIKPLWEETRAKL